MANPQNLKPWPKGTSGNLAGRPRTTLLTPALRQILGEPYPKDKAGRTFAEVIAERMVFEACRGNVRAAKEIRLCTERRPRLRVPPGRDTESQDRVAKSVARIKRRWEARILSSNSPKVP